MKNSSINNLALEKQLTHCSFCSAIQNIEDINELKDRLCEMHLLYLRQQEVFIKIAKSRYAQGNRIKASNQNMPELDRI